MSIGETKKLHSLDVSMFEREGSTQEMPKERLWEFYKQTKKNYETI